MFRKQFMPVPLSHRLKTTLQTFSVILMVVFFMVLEGQTAVSAPTDITYIPDQAFGESGFVYPSLQSFYQHSTTILQTAGNQLIAVDTHQISGQSRFGLTQYSADGVLDSNFGNAGIASEDLGTNDHALAGAIQPDGKIIVVGSSFNVATMLYHIQMMRFLPDGSLDLNFGTNGIVRKEMTGCTGATAVTLQSDEKILVAGCTSDANIVLLRYLPDGTIDNSFGVSGMATTRIGDLSKVVAILLQDDGSIVLAGRTNLLFRTFLVGYTGDGGLDNSFGNAGIVNLQLTSQDRIETAVLQEDGKIVLAGMGFPNGIDPAGILLARFNIDGTLDNTFGSTGSVLTDLHSAMGSGGTAVIQQSDGKLLVAGWTLSSHQSFITLLRYNSDGSLDTSLGHIGNGPIEMGEYVHGATDIMILPDEKIVLAGTREEQTYVAQLAPITIISRIYMPIGAR
ncbi:MAG: hypothetical protein AAF490_09730 [Chloroflexota bacterium]